MAVVESVTSVDETEVDELRSKLAAEFPDEPRAEGSDAGASDAFLEQRRDTYAEIRDLLRKFALDERWRDHPLTVDLFTALIDLERAIESDETGMDPDWEIREARGALVDVVDLILHEVEHRELDDPATAAHQVAEWLADVSDDQIGNLMGVEGRTIRSWRTKAPREVRADKDRVVLVAQLVYELRRSRGPAGVVRWFHRERPQLNGRSPYQLLKQSAKNEPKLRNLARGGRGQLDA